MAENVNLRAIVREYVNLNRHSGSNSVQNPNFDNVKIRIRSHQAAASTSPINTAPEVSVDNGGAGPELTTSKRLSNVVRVNLITGLCQDLENKIVRFPLDQETVDIRFKGGIQEVSTSHVDVELFSSCGNGAKAKAQTKMEEITYTCLSKVYPKGKVLLGQGSGSLDIQYMIQNLKDKNRPCVQAFQNDDKGYYWLLEGCYFKNVSVMHAHNWSS